MVTMRPRRRSIMLRADVLTDEDRAQQIAVDNRAYILGFDIDDIVWVRLAARRRDIAAGIVNKDIDRA